MTSPLADALASGSRFIKWDEEGPGTVVSGVITAITMRQARKFQSTDLDFWDDGTPKMQAIITITTDRRDPTDPDDDGTRSISVNLWSGQKAALAAACKAAGVTEPQPGQTFTAVWKSGVGKAGDPRIFGYALTGSPASGVADALATPPAAPAPAAAAPPAAAPDPDPAAVAAVIADMTPEQRAAIGL